MELHRHIRIRIVRWALAALEEQRVATPAIPHWRYPPADGSHEALACTEASLPGNGGPAWWSAPTVSQILSLIASARGEGSVHRGIFVNLGARDGRCRNLGDVDYLPGLEVADPANCLAERGHAGVMVEGDVAQFAGLRHALGRRFGRMARGGRSRVELALGWVDPAGAARTVVQAIRRLRRHGRAASRISNREDHIDLLKVDVDNCDCCFVEALLASGLRPRLIHAEVHAFLPPPLAFRP